MLAAPAQAQQSLITKWGSPGSGNGQFAIPNGVAVDPAGNVYVADSDNHRVQKFTSNGRFIRKWGTRGPAPGQLDYPVGVATDSRGNVYVVENSFDNQRVQKFTSTGAFIRQWGGEGAGDGQFSDPTAIATDAAGNVYVSDPGSPVPGFPGNNRIQKFTSDGVFITKFGGTFGEGDGEFRIPYGVTTDPAGNVYVVDNRNHRIQKFTSNGAFITKWGRQGNANGQFQYPFLIATDPDGNVYVGDSDNQRIQKFTSNGRFVGKWGTRGTGDGQFQYPSGIAVDAGGNVFVADGASSRIQKFGSRPVAGKRFNAELVSGTVFFKCRGRKRRRLTATTSLPVGCLIDARAGRVRIIAAANANATETKSAVFYDGRFRVFERRSRRPVTEMRLAGGLAGCGKGSASVAARKRRGRRLWGNGKGRFRTRGKRSAALVRGTIWLVEDRCDGTTLTRVRKGKVEVRDFRRKRSKIVRAGGRYVAR